MPRPSRRHVTEGAATRRASLDDEGSLMTVSQTVEDSSPPDVPQHLSPPTEEPQPANELGELRDATDCACVRLNGATLGGERHRLVTAAGFDCEVLFAGDDEPVDPEALLDELAKVVPRTLAALGRDVLRYRERAHLTQLELARHVALPLHVVQEVESGDGTYEDAARLLVGIADLLDG